MKAKYLKFHGNDLEDKAIYESFTLPDKGVMVDIGAGPDGIQGSNSYFFEKNGWKVLCVDADPRNKEALLKNRKHAYSLAVGSKVGKGKLHMHDSPDISVLSDAGEQEVDVVTLESLLEKEKIGQIDILSIDTEGTELEVWGTFDWKKHKPQIVIIEAVSSQVVNEKVPVYFESIGYEWVATIGPNLIYKWVERVRNPKRIVYGSSYDRGLEHLLKMWPDIRKEVPDAELRIFYGWVMFDRVMANNPERMAWKEKMEELMRQPGITHLGRISHGACEVEFKSAGIWAYPTHFGEISCITAMRAQALGAEPVVISYAALDETVQHGVKVEGDIYEPEIKEIFKQELIRALKNPLPDVKREEMMKWAKEQFAWSKVAKQWDQEFKSKPSLDKQVEELMDNNQALEAWNLVKDTDYPLKDRVYLKVQHAFEPERYTKYYSEELTEHPVPEDISTDCSRLAPRFKWVIAQIEQQKPKTLIDLGCADGYLPLTVATRGQIKCTGYNLYKPSIELATKRAKDHNLNCEFVCDDLFNAKGKYDAVVLMEVLEHIPDPKKAITHCMDLLEEGGVFYLSTPSPEHVGIEQHKNEPGHSKWDDGNPSGHLKLYSEAELKELLSGYNIKQFILDGDKCWLVEVTK